MYLPASKYVPKPQRARAGMPARRKSAMVSVENWRQLPIMRRSGGRGSTRGRGSRRRMQSTMADTGRVSTSSPRSAGTSTPYSEEVMNSWTMRLRAIPHSSSGSAGNPWAALGAGAGACDGDQQAPISTPGRSANLEAVFSTGAFARLAQVSVRTLHHYDDIGLLQPTEVDDRTGYRWYSAEQLARLHRILALRDLGFSLTEMQAIVDEEVSLDELRGML